MRCTSFVSFFALLTTNSAASAWFANDMSMTLAGWPSAAARLIRRPSPSTKSFLPSSWNSSTNSRTATGPFAPFFNPSRSISTLKKVAKGPVAVREFVEEFQLDGKKLFVLGEGRLINLAAAEGHPASVMDMSFANQALAAEYVVNNAKKLTKDVHRIPADLDQEIARLKLQSMGVAIDTLTAAQRKYLASWDMGT